MTCTGSIGPEVFPSPSLYDAERYDANPCPAVRNVCVAAVTVVFGDSVWRQLLQLGSLCECFELPRGITTRGAPCGEARRGVAFALCFC